MRLLRPAAVLLTAQDLRTDITLLVPAAGDSETARWLDQGELKQWRDQNPAAPQVEHFEGELWTSPLFMLHAHLESWDAPSAGWQRSTFSAWVKDLLQWRQFTKRMDFAASAKASWSELQQGGCAAVLASVGEAVDLANLPADASRVLCREWFAPSSDDAEQWQDPQRNCVALHSPFGVSEDLASRAFRWQSQQSGRCLSLHLGEHADERRYLAANEGPLADLMMSRGRPLKTKQWSSPLDWLEEVAPGARPGVLAVHCGDLQVEELVALQQKEVSVVWCPGTHLYFDRPKPAFAAAGDEPPLLGCDSRASNAELNPMRELRLARQILPQFSAAAWWNAATDGGRRFWQQFIQPDSPAPSVATSPLRFTNPGLSSAAEVCDYLTCEPELTPIAAPGIPSP